MGPHKIGRSGRHLASVAVMFVVSAQAHEGEEPQIPQEPALGKLGNLIPFHKDAIHISVVWPRTRPPQLCFWMRPAEYRGTDLVDPSIGPLGELRENFRRLVLGGYRFSATLEESVRTRILSDLDFENTLCADLPRALVESNKHHVEDLTAADFAANASAFHDAGHSRGLNYNLFCAGNVMLADGRLAVIGGHDKAGNHGIRKINIYDPETERWLPRPMPGAMEDFLADPYDTSDPPNRTGLYEVNTDPADPADMTYQRWYPSAVTLPDGKVLVLGGSDQNSDVGPTEAPLTKVRIATPEVYDPLADRSIALESARKTQAMYARSFVVQTGRGWNDWKVLSMGEAVPPFPTGTELRAYDPWHYDGKTFLFDVQAALADPARDVPGENHWHHFATAAAGHESGAVVNLRYLDYEGMPQLQRIVAFGGSDQNGENAIVEMLDLRLADHRGITTGGWRTVAQLPFALTQNHAAILPDGDVVVLGGEGEVGTVRMANLAVQLFRPSTGQLTQVGTMSVPRHDHANATLLPDGRVLISGGNRVELSSDRDLGVPVGQIYSPPYLFTGGERPVIESAPERIQYGAEFELAAKGTISEVALLRIGPTTHNWTWGNAYLRLHFTPTIGGLKVVAPKVPGAAVPGLYMLFVLDENRVPSIGQRVVVGPS